MPVSPSLETRQFIFTANQLTGFYMRATLAFNGLNLSRRTTLVGLRGVFRTLSNIYENFFQKEPTRGVPRKRYSENMQQIYRRSPMPKSNFSKVAKQLCENRTLA